MQIVLHVRTHDKSCRLYDTYKHIRYIALHIQISRGPNKYGTHVAFVHPDMHTHTHSRSLPLSFWFAIIHTHTHTRTHNLSLFHELPLSIAERPPLSLSHTHNFSLAYKLFLLGQLSLPSKCSTSSPDFVMSSRSLYLCLSKRVLQVTVKKRPTNNRLLCKRDMNNHLCTGILAYALCKRAYILELKEPYKW